MMDLQAAIGIHQLKRIGEYNERRREIWEQYNEAFKDLPVTLPDRQKTNSRHAFHLYTILLDQKHCGINRDSFLNAMTEQNIGVGVHYLSIPEHPYYQNTYGWNPEEYPNAMRVGRQTVSLPLSAKLLNEDVHNVINAVRNILC